MIHTVLIVEGKHADVPSFAADVQKKGLNVVSVSNGGEAVARLVRSGAEVVVINAASMRSTGVRICQAIREKDDRMPIVLIVDSDKEIAKDTADAILMLPFTAQKLVNRIKPLLPGEGTNVVHAGPIKLDIEQRRVKCLGKNTKLTPRLMSILYMLIQHRGEVVDREELFKKVWETNYTGDTRTLDVHISWLRRAIELDPDRPRLLHTVRGLGYRLDV